jgi:hypothetical protein
MNIVITGPGPHAQEVGQMLAQWLTATTPANRIIVLRDEEEQHAQIERLRNADLGVICVTPQNSRSAVLFFQAGVLAGRAREVPMISLLAGVNPVDFAGSPLGQMPWKELGFDALERLAHLAGDHANMRSTAFRESVSSAWHEWASSRRKSAHFPHGDYLRWSRAGLETDPTEPNYKLSALAEAILLEAVEDRTGSIIMVRTMHGLHLQVNKKLFAEPGNSRSEAEGRSVVRQLLHDGLIETRGEKGEVFSLTAEGFRVADALRKSNAKK